MRLTNRIRKVVYDNKHLLATLETKIMTLPSTRNEYAEGEVEILNDEGLHMRPAMQFVDCANQFESDIKVYKDSQGVDGKSIMQITMLAATKGTQLKITASGNDAQKAIATLSNLIQQKSVNQDV